MKEVLLEMLSHYGMQEVEGPQANPEIVAFFKDLGYDVKDDETSWCAASLNYYLKQCGYEYTGKLDARSFLKLSVIVLKPTLGDIVVLWRESPESWKGHVGLFINWNTKYVWLLGGNQGNALSITAFPRERVLGCRRANKIK